MAAPFFAQHLLTKAAERLRRGDYFCRRLGLHLSWVADLGGWWDETDFLETRDTGFPCGGSGSDRTGLATLPIDVSFPAVSTVTG